MIRIGSDDALQPGASRSSRSTTRSGCCSKRRPAATSTGWSIEAAGRIDLAVELYEQNVDEGFVGDWPYSRLVSVYERQGAYDEAERVLRRAIEVTRADRRKPAADRTEPARGAPGRLRVLKKKAQAARARAKQGGAAPGHTFVPLPMVDNPR